MGKERVNMIFSVIGNGKEKIQLDNIVPIGQGKEKSVMGIEVIGNGKEKIDLEIVSVQGKEKSNLDIIVV